LIKINSTNNQDLARWQALTGKAVDTNPKNWKNKGIRAAITHTAQQDPIIIIPL
jgi:hypothetical protein